MALRDAGSPRRPASAARGGGGGRKTPKFRGDPVALAADPRVQSLQAGGLKPQPPSSNLRSEGGTRGASSRRASNDENSSGGEGGSGAADSIRGRTVAGLADGAACNDWVARRLHVPDAPHHANQACALSADGRRLVSACSDSTMRAWDLWSEGAAARSTVLREYAGAVRCCALSADGKALVAGSQLGSLRLWRLQDGDSPRSACSILRGHNGAVRSCALSADGSMLVTVGSILRTLECATVVAWNLRTGKSRQLWGPGQFVSGSSPTFTSCSISADGCTIVAGADDCAVWVWQRPAATDLPGVDPLVILHGHQGCVTCCALSSDGLTVVSGSTDRCVRVWDLDSNRRRDNLVLKGSTDAISCCAISADGTSVVTGSEDGQTRVWCLIDVYAGRCIEPTVLQPPPSGHAGVAGNTEPRGAIRCCAIDASGDTVVSAGAKERACMVWDLIYRRSSRMVWDVLYRGAYPGGPSLVPSSAPGAARQDEATLTEVDVNRMHLRLTDRAASHAAQAAKEWQQELVKKEEARVTAAAAAASRQQRALGVSLASTPRTGRTRMDRLAEAHSTAIESAQTELWTRLFLHSRSGDALKRLWSLPLAVAETPAPEAAESGSRAVVAQTNNSRLQGQVEQLVTNSRMVHSPIDRTTTEALIDRLHPSDTKRALATGTLSGRTTPVPSRGRPGPAKRSARKRQSEGYKK